MKRLNISISKRKHMISLPVLMFAMLLYLGHHSRKRRNVKGMENSKPEKLQIQKYLLKISDS